jgi:hypothetical protein
LVRFQRGFENGFTKLRAAYHDILKLAIEHRRIFVGGFMAFVFLSFLLAPFLGRNFFPEVDGGQILMHVRAPVGMRIEGTAAKFNEVEKAIRQIIPPAETAAVVDNIGTYLSSLNTIYNNTGTIGESDGDITISLSEGHKPTPDYVAKLRRRAAAPLSRHDLLVPAGGHRQPDLEFRCAGAHRSAGPRQQSRRGLRVRQQAAIPGPSRHRRGRRAHSTIGASAAIEREHRSQPRGVHGRDRGRRDQQLGRQPGEFLPGGPDLLAQ